MASSTGPMGPSQQLGAVPGTPTGVLGNEGLGPEDDMDGAEFASSGEADVAPRSNGDDLDIELSDDVLERIRAADLTAREAANLLLEPSVESVGYGVNLTERVKAGDEEGGRMA